MVRANRKLAEQGKAFRKALEPLSKGENVPTATVQRAWAVPLYTSLYIPLAVLALLAFLTFDRLRSGEFG